MDNIKLFCLSPEPVKLDNGQTVHIRRMTAAARVEYGEYITETYKDGVTASLTLRLDDMAHLLSKTICDAEGKLLLPDPEQVKQIDFATLSKLHDVAFDINGFSTDGKAAAKKK